jgi:hypothetical protein
MNNYTKTIFLLLMISSMVQLHAMESPQLGLKNTIKDPSELELEELPRCSIQQNFYQLRKTPNIKKVFSEKELFIKKRKLFWTKQLTPIYNEFINYSCIKNLIKKFAQADWMRHSWKKSDE